MECATLYAMGHGFLQLLRILLAWPSVFLICAVVLTKRFRNPLKGILAAVARTIREGKNQVSAAGVTITMEGRQRADSNADAVAVEESLATPPPSSKDPEWNGDADVSELSREANEWREAAAHNAVRYLELLLAPKTKSLLYFIRDKGKLTQSHFDWLASILSREPSEAEAIRRVILDNGLAEEDEGTIRATPTLSNWVAIREASGNEAPPAVYDIVTHVLSPANLTAGDYVDLGGASKD